MIYVKQKISFVALGEQKSVLPAPPSPSVALTVLRGQKWCSSWPFVDSKSCSPRPSAALRVLRGQKRCSPRPLVALRGQKKAVLRAPPRPSVSSADKKGVLPAPSWPLSCSPCPSADKNKLFSPCPSVDKKAVHPDPSRIDHTLPLQSQFTQTPTTPNLNPAHKVLPPSGP